jgi:hypothetical protein
MFIPTIPDPENASDPVSGSETLVSNKGLLSWTTINKSDMDANTPVQVEVQSKLRFSVDE